MRSVVAIVLCAVALGASAADVRTRVGSEVKLPMGYVVLNEKSTLTRTHYVIDVPAMPVKLKDVPGVNTIYQDRNYRWESNTDDVVASEKVTAFEVRFLLVDVFGNRVETLSATEVADLDAGAEMYPNWMWRVRFDSETDAKSMLTTFAWVAQARKADGSVIKASEAQVLQAIKPYLPSISNADLSPEPSK